MIRTLPLQLALEIPSAASLLAEEGIYGDTVEVEIMDGEAVAVYSWVGDTEEAEVGLRF